MFDVLDEKQVQYEIVKEIKQNTEATAYYEFTTGKIYFREDMVDSPIQLRYFASHELIHKIRYEAGVWTGNSALEEVVAIMMAEEISDFVGFGSFSIDEKFYIEKTLAGEGLDQKSVPSDLKKYFEETRKLFREWKTKWE